MFTQEFHFYNCMDSMRSSVALEERSSEAGMTPRQGGKEHLCDGGRYNRSMKPVKC
jgi:hypothetical protein